MLRIETPRLVLRPIAESDRAEVVRAHAVNAAFWKPWLPTPGDDDRTAEAVFDKLVARSREELAKDTGRVFGAFLRDDRGTLAGVFTLILIHRFRFQNAYAGWRVNVEVARQGLGTEAVTALLDYAFAPQPTGAGLHRVQANIIPTNAPSIRLAKKLRFRREGLAKQHLHIDGRWQDHLMFAKLAEEHRREYVDPVGG
jgi:ribosomal-protein-alanine N-acetyltransferase